MTSRFTGKSFSSKDEMRIADIVFKSHGSSVKAEQLARNMADKITDVDKALARAYAAQDANEHGLAAIFFIRYGQLGGR